VVVCGGVDTLRPLWEQRKATLFSLWLLTHPQKLKVTSIMLGIAHTLGVLEFQVKQASIMAAQIDEGLLELISPFIDHNRHVHDIDGLENQVAYILHRYHFMEDFETIDWFVMIKKIAIARYSMVHDNHDGEDFHNIPDRLVSLVTNIYNEISEFLTLDDLYELNLNIRAYLPRDAGVMNAMYAEMERLEEEGILEQRRLYAGVDAVDAPM
jgi:hypothetical protein